MVLLQQFFSCGAERPHSPHIHTNKAMKKPQQLAPIAEVKRVTFAAQFVRNHADPDSYSPVDVVRVRFIPHVSDYNKAETKSIWYGPQEIKSMKKRAYRDADTRRAELRLDADPTVDARGLERLLDSNESTRLRYEALRALLHEQYRQRCLQYGTRNPGGIARHDQGERLRTMVMAAGQSGRSLALAKRLAMQDAADAAVYLGHQKPRIGDQEEQPEDREDSAPYPDSALLPQEPPEPAQTPSETRSLLSKMEAEATRATAESCCWCVDVVEAIGRSLVLHALLQPFFTLPRGDALVLDPQ